jgi:hypothetical protein
MIGPALQLDNHVLPEPPNSNENIMTGIDWQRTEFFEGPRQGSEQSA